MFHNTSSHYVRDYDRDYDRDNRSGNFLTRAIGVGMGYSGGAGEAKKGETSERIGDYRDNDRYYGSSNYNTGFGSNYGTGSSYSYGYPYEHNTNRYNTTASHLSTYPSHYDNTNRYGYDSNRYDTSRNYYNNDSNRYSGYANTSGQYNSYDRQYPTGYRTVHETREIVRDSDSRPFGHSTHYSRNFDRDNNTDRYYTGFNATGNYNTDRHYGASNYGRF